MIDSVVLVLVTNRLNERLDNGSYSWPGWYLKEKEPGIRYPDDNYEYLLRTKYHVYMGGPYNGCLAQRAFVLYDSLMANAILKKHGPDFFGRSRKEAEDLKKNRKGLTLPSANGITIENAILRDFCFLDTLEQPSMAIIPTKYLCIWFKGDTIVDTYLGFRGWSGIQKDDTYRYSDLLEKIKKYQWVGPRFGGLPINGVVYFDFDFQRIGFLQFY